MSHSWRYIELALVIVSVTLLHVSARDRVLLPDVRPLRSVRWWFPWPLEREFRTQRAYRLEQAGRLLVWAFVVLTLIRDYFGASLSH